MEKREKIFINGLIASGLIYALSNHPSNYHFQKNTLNELTPVERTIIQEEREKENRAYKEKARELRQHLKELNPRGYQV